MRRSKLGREGEGRRGSRSKALAEPPFGSPSEAASNQRPRDEDLRANKKFLPKIDLKMGGMDQHFLSR